MKQNYKIFALFLFLSVNMAAQTVVDKTITVDGKLRTYKCYVPAQPKGLIVALHGLGGSSDFFFNNYPITGLADQTGYVILAPQALAEQNAAVTATLNTVGALAGIHISTNAVWGCGMGIIIPAIPIILPTGMNIELNAAVADEEFIRQIIENTLADYNLPNNNIFLFGVSMGGFMTYQYAEKYPEQLSGIISIAGSRGLVIDGISAVKLPVLDFHSLQDETVPYNGTTSTTIMGATVKVSFSQGKPDVMDYWISRNGANTIPVVENIANHPSVKNITVTKYTYAQAEGNDVIHYQMSGTEPDIPYHSHMFSAANGDCMDYAEEIAKFITKHSGPTSNETIRTTTLQAYAQDGTLYISGLTAGQTVRVYTITGTLIYASPSPSGGEQFSLFGGVRGSFPLPGHGVYIVTDGKDVVKVGY